MPGTARAGYSTTTDGCALTVPGVGTWPSAMGWLEDMYRRLVGLALRCVDPPRKQGPSRCPEAARGRSVPFRRGERALPATFPPCGPGAPAAGDSLVPRATPPRDEYQRLLVPARAGVCLTGVLCTTRGPPPFLTNFPSPAPLHSKPWAARPNKSRRWPCFFFGQSTHQSELALCVPSFPPQLTGCIFLGWPFSAPDQLLAPPRVWLMPHAVGRPIFGGDTPSHFLPSCRCSLPSRAFCVRRPWVFSLACFFSWPRRRRPRYRTEFRGGLDRMARCVARLVQRPPWQEAESSSAGRPHVTLNSRVVRAPCSARPYRAGRLCQGPSLSPRLRRFCVGDGQLDIEISRLLCREPSRRAWPALPCIVTDGGPGPRPIPRCWVLRAFWSLSGAGGREQQSRQSSFSSEGITSFVDDDEHPEMASPISSFLIIHVSREAS